MALNLKNGTFAHGTHPKEFKEYSKDIPIEFVPAPSKILLALSQNIGAPSNLSVKAKQEVNFGDKIADSGGFVSVPLHSSIKGVVKKSEKVTMPNGRRVDAVPVVSGKEDVQKDTKEVWDETFGGKWDIAEIDKYSSEEISKLINEAGIVGLGGATFPTHVKLMTNPKTPIDTFIINACECEPFLTTDYRMLLEASEAITIGTLLGAKAVSAKTIVIAIEDNKPDAIKIMTEKVSGTNIKIATLKTKYPQGSEKQLIKAVTNREVSPGALPSEVGVTVSNVGTVAAVAAAVIRKKPLTHRVICLTGSGIKNPKNLFAPIGITFKELIEFCGGLKPSAKKVISGGPMMGFSFGDLNTPVIKGVSGVTILDKTDTDKETNCVRCGRCVEVCPMFLVPTKLALASKNKDVSIAEKYKILSCFECGSCAFVCPAQLPIVQLIRVGKSLVMASKKKN